MTVATPTLQPYLPRMVLDWQRSAPDALVREIEGSMVLVDVSGFTTMSERLARHGNVGAEEVADVIGDTFETLLAEAYACGGSLLQFGGDALLLFFAEEGHAQRAAVAAHARRAEADGHLHHHGSAISPKKAPAPREASVISGGRSSTSGPCALHAR